MENPKKHKTCKIIRFPNKLFLILISFSLCFLFSQDIKARISQEKQGIKLKYNIDLNLNDRELIYRLPPLKIGAMQDALPLSDYKEEKRAYTGISVDIFKFIASELKLKYEFIDEKLSLREQIEKLQKWEIDLVMPLSYTKEREKEGIFSLPYYRSYYTLIAKNSSQLPVFNEENFSKYRIGYIKGSALERELKEKVPPHLLHPFHIKNIRLFYEALRNGNIDLAVHNRSFFNEDRYNLKLFDLESIYIFKDSPRNYSFYFANKPEYRQLSSIFNRYMQAMDLSNLISIHESSEEKFIENYLKQNKREFLFKAGILIVLAFLALMFFILQYYYQMSMRLKMQSMEIEKQKNELKNANRELKRLSLTDELTKLANRRMFKQVLKREHARFQRTGSPFSLLILDLDDFKLVNDQYGHLVGDDYLCAVARVIRKHCQRSLDIAARYGGEEMACVLPDTDIIEARILAERIRKSVFNLKLANRRSKLSYLSVSIGVVTLATPGYDVEALIAQADVKLYEAKKSGKNQIASIRI